MNTKKFYDSADEFYAILSAQERLTANRKIRLPDADGTLMVGTDNISIEGLYGKRYVAALTQTRILAPVATVFTPSTSALYGIVWTWTDRGVFTGTLAGAFTLDGSTDLWLRDTRDLVSFEVTTVNTVVLTMTDNDTLSSRRIEINVL